MATGIIRRGCAISTTRTQGGEGSIRRAQTLPRRGRLLLGCLALAIEQALNRRHQQRAILRHPIDFPAYLDGLLCQFAGR